MGLGAVAHWTESQIMVVGEKHGGGSYGRWGKNTDPPKLKESGFQLWGVLSPPNAVCCFF